MELIGRDDEIMSIRAFFAEAGVRGGALVVVGEAGIGKTAVLRAVATGETARGARVLQANGVQFEAKVSYSALNQLLFPLGEGMAPLGAAHRIALRCALGFEIGPAPDRLVVSNAALLLLRAVASDTPLLITIDDLHWVDRASAEVFGFVARRLVGSPISLLAACRSAESGFFRNGGLAEFVLPPLPTLAARTLVDSCFPELAPAVRRRLIEEAAGNPLALLELPSALDGDQRTDFTMLPAILPMSDRLKAVFASRVRGLPERCRLMLLLGALGGTSDLTRLRAAGGSACDIDDLRPVADGRLVQVSATRLNFRHPLIAAAVVEACSERERRWAHGVLAEVYPDAPERRVQHLAASADGPDATVAAQLDAAAHLLLSQGDAIGAVAALTRAAELSPEPADQSQRLAEAAYIGADAGGELATATRLLGDARRTGSLDTHSLAAAAAAAHLLINSDGDVTTAHRLLAAAIQAGDHGFDADRPILIEALHNLLLISWYVGTEQAWLTLRSLVDRLTPAPPPLLRVTVSVFSDPARASVGDVADLDELIDTVSLEGDPTRLIRIGTAAVFADRLPRLRRAERHLRRMRHEGRGPARRHLGALMHLGIDGFHSGRWEETRELADEGLTVCNEHGLHFFHWYFHYLHALVAAGRGQVEAARQLTDDMRRWGIAHQAAGVGYFSLQARTLNDIGAGDYEAAYQNAVRLTPAGHLAAYRPTALWAGLDLVEAGLHTGHRAEAVAHANALQGVRIRDVSPRLGLAAAAATALTADDSTARPLFEAALSLPESEQWPFELARVRLAYGQRLRRLRDTGAAREQLTIAHELFAALGSQPWRDRAAGELRATGMTRQTAGATRSPLTPQEREIADLAGAGLTNKEIGQKLFISHRTVADHLYKIFPKLGITSRAALRDALATDER